MGRRQVVQLARELGISSVAVADAGRKVGVPLRGSSATMTAAQEAAIRQWLAVHPAPGRPQVRGQCWCCRMQSVVVTAVEVAGSQVLRCGDCAGHEVGDDPVRLRARDGDHVRAWARLAADRERANEQEVCELVEQIRAWERTVTVVRSELDTVRAELPVQVQYLDPNHELLDRLRDSERRAWDRVDMWGRLLAQVQVAHRDGGGGRCRCGLALSACPTVGMDFGSAFARWVAHQTRRARQGQRHRLPPGHPGVIDPRWVPPGEDGVDVEPDEWGVPDE